MKNGKQTKKSKKVLVIVLVVLVVLVLGATAGIGAFLVNYAIGRAGDGGNRQVALEVNTQAVAQVKSVQSEHTEAQKQKTMDFMERVPEEKVTITAADGLKLAGFVYAQEDSHQWAIVIHGYRGNHYGMMNYAQHYYDAGYQVLAPDLRACGESEGDYVGMGWPDRLDMLKWIDWILAQDAEARIVLHGVSMGGATVMMTSGEALPEAVIAMVEDCGYTSVWDIFSSELNLRFHLPAFPVLYSASGLSKLNAGYGFHEASSLNQVAKSTVPMLFIHGEEDNFVPFWMLQKVYDAKPGSEKQLVTVEGAGHGRASSVMGEDYWKTVFEFIGRYQ